MLETTTHRPYPPPRAPWALFMRWEDLAFLHWPVPEDAIRPVVPASLTLDTFDGQAWLGVTPFRMSGVRPRLTPRLPGVSSFPEVNVRTYVTADGRPGIWFLSLDAASRLAVRAARAVFGLPYFRADMKMAEEGGRLAYRSIRTDEGAGRAELRLTYGPSSAVYRSRPGELDHWLTERYCLYAVRRGTLLRGDIHHEPWPLQSGTAEIRTNSMVEAARIGLPSTPPLVHFARRLDVVAWLPKVVARGQGPAGAAATHDRA